MYGTLRVLKSNWITENQLLPTLGDTGYFSGVIKEGLGSGIVAATGNFASYEDLLFTVKITSVSSGKEVGQAKFKVYDARNGWSSEITTSSTPISITGYYDLGLYLAFTGGSGNDFELNDLFYFTGVAAFGDTKMLDERRDTLCRKTFTSSTAFTQYIYQTITPFLSSSKSLAFAIFDLKSTNGGFTNNHFTLTLTAGDGATTHYTKSITPQQVTPMIVYMTDMPAGVSLSWFKLTWTYASASVSNPYYLHIGHMFLGEYYNLSSPDTAWWGSENTITTNFIGQTIGSSVPRGISSNQTRLLLKFERQTPTQIATLEDIFLSSRDDTAKRERPVFLHETADDDNTMRWMVLDGDFKKTYTAFNQTDVDLELMEVQKGYVF